MQESILVISGVITGTVFSLAGCCLGAYLVKRAYQEITDPHQIAFKFTPKDDNSRGLNDEDGSYDWDSYDQYISRAEDDDDGVPEA